MRGFIAISMAVNEIGAVGAWGESDSRPRHAKADAAGYRGAPVVFSRASGANMWIRAWRRALTVSTISSAGASEIRLLFAREARLWLLVDGIGELEHQGTRKISPIVQRGRPRLLHPPLCVQVEVLDFQLDQAPHRCGDRCADVMSILSDALAVGLLVARSLSRLHGRTRPRLDEFLHDRDCRVDRAVRCLPRDRCGRGDRINQLRSIGRFPGTQIHRRVVALELTRRTKLSVAGPRGG